MKKSKTTRKSKAVTGQAITDPHLVALLSFLDTVGTFRRLSIESQK